LLNHLQMISFSQIIVSCWNFVTCLNSSKAHADNFPPHIYLVLQLWIALLWKLNILVILIHVILKQDAYLYELVLC